MIFILQACVRVAFRRKGRLRSCSHDLSRRALSVCKFTLCLVNKTSNLRGQLLFNT